MNRTSTVKLITIHGIDLDYRPRNYFWAAELKVSLVSHILGEARRQMVRARLDRGTPISDGLDAATLDTEMRAAWGRLHPSNMGGEYLPPLRKGEVEIARISLQSVTADQISIRARPLAGRIGYRIVDEYPDSLNYVCHPASSVSPLSLGGLITLVESANEGGSTIFPMLEIDARDSPPAELATFITVTSDFYADLERYYRALIDAWIAERAQGKSNES